MNLLVVAGALLVGWRRGYRLDDLLNYRFRGLWQFFFALVLQLLLGTAYAEAHPVIRTAGPLLYLGSMGLLLWALADNWRLSGARLAFAGVLLNLAVIFANGGKMPVSAEALSTIGFPASSLAYLTAGRSLTHRLMRADTLLPWLGDLLYLPRPYPRSPVFSAGDVVLAGGLFFFVVGAMAATAAVRRRASAAAAQVELALDAAAAGDDPGPAPSECTPPPPL